jgi:hypothetical protein
MIAGIAFCRALPLRKFASGVFIHNHLMPSFALAYSSIAILTNSVSFS